MVRTLEDNNCQSLKKEWKKEIKRRKEFFFIRKEEKKVTFTAYPILLANLYRGQTKKISICTHRPAQPETINRPMVI